MPSAIHRSYAKPLCGSLLLWGLMVCSQAVYAAGMNCDVRQLALSQAQKNQLKILRNNNRLTLDEIKRSRPSSATAKRSLAQILMQDEFNDAAARRYVSQKYEYNAALDMQDLRMQHYFFKVLTPAQKKMWLNHCLE